MNKFEYNNYSISVANYKCFDMVQNLEQLSPVNVVIGKNNTGKSALLDVIEYLTEPAAKDVKDLSHKAGVPNIFLTSLLNKDLIDMSFSSATSGGSGGIGNHHSYGMTFLDKKMDIQIQNNDTINLISLGGEDLPSFWGDSGHKFSKKICSNFKNPFLHKKIRKISADRDIISEKKFNSDPYLDSNGTGITSLIEHIINRAGIDSNIVKKVLLDSLNTIFAPDINFISISVQDDTEGFWEIYLEEEDKGLISLSNSGSGLKTVLLVLANTILIPHILSVDIGNFIFSFEELENNLHPHIQRNLFSYLEEYAVKNNTLMFLTTHSNIVIDIFSSSKNSQIFHIEHNSKKSTIKQVKSWSDNVGILEDLDFRASDLLQSNGIIWVEGPSDRVYVNKYIDLLTNGGLREGLHYRCLFYGGRLLSHLSASQNEKNEAINILEINKNSIVIIDSDKKNKNSVINKTKSRIKDEVEKNNGLSLVTKGREIENYIPFKSLSNYLKDKSIKIPENRKLEQFEKIETFLDDCKAGLGDIYKNNKVLFASNVIKYIELDNLAEPFDLQKKMESIITSIRSWNKISD